MESGNKFTAAGINFYDKQVFICGKFTQYGGGETGKSCLLS